MLRQETKDIRGKGACHQDAFGVSLVDKALLARCPEKSASRIKSDKPHARTIQMHIKELAVVLAWQLQKEFQLANKYVVKLGRVWIQCYTGCLERRLGLFSNGTELARDQLRLLKDARTRLLREPSVRLLRVPSDPESCKEFVPKFQKHVRTTK